MRAASPVERAERVAEAAAPESDEIHRQGRMTEAVLAALVDTNMFRVSAPRPAGGDEVDLVTYAKVLETVGRADLSAGWCIVQANASSRSFGSRLEPDVAQRLLAGPDTAIAAGFPMGAARADKVDGGYVVNGRWGFASGCLHCNWFDARATVHVDGEPVATETGFSLLASHLVPVDEVSIEETWDVAGLRGTGSHTYVIEDVFVPHELSLPLFAPTSPDLSPALRVPALTFAHMGFAAMGLGAGWGALDDFLALLEKKTPGLSSTPLCQTATAQRTLAEARSRLRAASAHLYWAAGELVEACEQGAPSREQLADARLAIVSTVDASLATIEQLYRVAGTSGIFNGSSIQRRFQDIHVLSQQLFARPSHYENVGRLLLGLDHEPGLI